MQPDSIIPNPANPQNLNRFGYVLNNPIRFVDPSGHVPIDCYGTDYCGGSPQEKLLQAYIRLQEQVEAGEIESDFEAFARLAEYAAIMTPDCTSCFVDNMGAVLTGFTGTTPGLDVIRNRRYPDRYPLSDTFVQIGNDRFGQSGFAQIFRDNSGRGDQSRHFWIYVQSAYFEGFAVSWMGNAFHETIDPSVRAGQRTTHDFVLGLEGTELGFYLGNGFLSPQDVGPYIRNNLAPDSFSAWSWSHPLGTINNYLEWSSQR